MKTLSARTRTIIYNEKGVQVESYHLQAMIDGIVVDFVKYDNVEDLLTNRDKLENIFRDIDSLSNEFKFVDYYS